MPNMFPSRRYGVAIVLSVILVILVITVPGSYFGARFAPGTPFTIIGPTVLVQGEEAVITWDSSPENAGLYPNEKIELCPFATIRTGCMTIAANTPNIAAARVLIPSTIEPGSYVLRLTARNAAGQLLAFKTTTRPVEVRQASVLLPGDRLRVRWDNDTSQQYPAVKIEFCTVGMSCYALAYSVPNTGTSPQIVVPEGFPLEPGAIRVRARAEDGSLAMQTIGTELRLVELPAAFIGSLQPVADGRIGIGGGFDGSQQTPIPPAGGTPPETATPTPTSGFSPAPAPTNSTTPPPPAGGPTCAPLPANTAEPCEDESVVRALTVEGIFNETNRHRLKNRLAPFELNQQLNQAAQLKLQDMFEKQYIGHVTPETNWTAGYFQQQAGYAFVWWGENLAGGTFAGDVDIVRRWMCSSSHKANIVKPRFKDFGAAVGQGVFQGNNVWLAVQMFGDPDPGEDAVPAPSCLPPPAGGPTSSPSPTPSQPPTTSGAAFPGAQGYGAAASGGRGGRVIEVTNLNDSGAGSLREAVSSSGARIVVFRVGGTISLSSELNITNPNITIAGQTAPGDGVTLSFTGSNKHLLRISTSNVIIRYMRFRVGASHDNADSVHVHDGANNVIIDHSTIAWGTDENLDIYSNEGGTVQNITIQHSIIGQAVNGGDENALGALVSGLKESGFWRRVTNIDLHHNILAHNTHRNPRIVSKGTKVINNIIYNWNARAADSEGDTSVDWIGNYFQKGPMSTSNIIFHATTEPNGTTPLGNASIHIAQNIAPELGFGNPASDNWSMIKDHYKGGGIPTSLRRTAPLSGGQIPITVQSPGAAWKTSLLQDVGANKKLTCEGSWAAALDPIDSNIVRSITNGTGASSVSGLPRSSTQASGGYSPSTSTAACADADHDGMPDTWETAKGLNPNNASDASQNSDNDTWTNIEEYLNGTDPKT